MKIFYLITKSEIGGAQMNVEQLASFFAGSTENEVVVMAAPGGWLERVLREKGIPFISNKYLAGKNPLTLYLAWRKTGAAIRSFRPDVVHCHSTVAGIIGRLYFRRRYAVVFTAHGWSFNQNHGKLLRAAAAALERLLAEQTNKIICVSEFVYQSALERKIAPQEKLLTIYNGVALPFKSSENISTNGEVKLSFVGRLCHDKNPLILIKAIEILPKDVRRRVRLDLVGDGPLKEEVVVAIKEAGLNEFIRLHGSLDHDGALSIISQSDIFILPSVCEAFPYVILEAMAHGVAVIATDVGGNREAVGEDCGLIIPKNDATALSAAIEQLVINDGLRKSFANTGLGKVRRKFSVESMLQEYMEMYSHLMI